jgi:hypothetical protein
MPVNISVDKDARVVYTIIEGAYSADDILGAFDELFQNPDFEPGMNGITDLRKAHSFLSHGDIIRVAEYLVKNRDKIGQSKTAVLVANDVSFGTTRMFQTYADDSSIQTRLFHDISAARRWIGLDE